MKTTCNNCLDEFEIEPAGIQTVTVDDLEIQFFACPSCGRKYVVFAANEEMKKMIVRRGELQKKIKVAHIGKYRQKVIRGLVAEQEKIIKAQKKLSAELKPRAELLLKELEVRATLPVVTRAAALRGDPCFETECRATDLWALLHDDPPFRVAGREYTEKFIR